MNNAIHNTSYTHYFSTEVDYMYRSDSDNHFVNPICDDVMGELVLLQHVFYYDPRNKDWTMAL